MPNSLLDIVKLNGKIIEIQNDFIRLADSNNCNYSFNQCNRKNNQKFQLGQAVCFKAVPKIHLVLEIID